jgi:hypothetical protein
MWFKEFFGVHLVPKALDVKLVESLKEAFQRRYSDQVIISFFLLLLFFLHVLLKLSEVINGAYSIWMTGKIPRILEDLRNSLARLQLQVPGMFLLFTFRFFSSLLISNF